MNWLATAAPYVVALLALGGVGLGVLTQRQKTRLDDRAQFMAGVLAEVQSLRLADQANEKQVSALLTQLQTAQLELVRCEAARAAQALEIAGLKRRKDSNGSEYPPPRS